MWVQRYRTGRAAEVLVAVESEAYEDEGTPAEVKGGEGAGVGCIVTGRGGKGWEGAGVSAE